MEPSIEAAITEAHLAVANAQEAREFHRKRTKRGDAQRSTDLVMAYQRVKAAMLPLRSESGRFSHQSPTPRVLERQEKIREASLALQRERRKLWKMLTPDERTA
jgi:hypothetical protein